MITESVLPAEALVRPLHSLARGERARIERLAEPSDPADRDVLLRLIELGFLPGEPLQVVAKGRAGGEPLAVRLAGQATFALRTREAGWVQVRPLSDAESSA